MSKIDASALALPPEFEFNEARREIVRNFKGSVNELVSRLDYCGFPKYFIKQHAECYHEYHGTKRPTLNESYVPAVVEDGTCRPLLPEPSLRDAALNQGAAPLEYSSDEEEQKSDSDDEHMKAFGASMLAAAAHAGHPYPKPLGHSVAAGAPCAKAAPAAAKPPRKSMFDLTDPPVDKMRPGGGVCVRPSPPSPTMHDSKEDGGYEYVPTTLLQEAALAQAKREPAGDSIAADDAY